MADPWIIDVELDERTILWRSADVEQERRIAIFDLLEDNSFAPQRQHPDGYAGPYRIKLSVEDGRLVLAIHREDDSHLETLILALGRFRRAGTAVEPWRTSTALVTNGVYRFTRNPMYLAMALLYLGAALAADSVLALVLLPPLLVLVRVGVISREERYLERRFGDEYRRYRSSVRRWL